MYGVQIPQATPNQEVQALRVGRRQEEEGKWLNFLSLGGGGGVIITVDSRYNKLLGPSEITLLYIEILSYAGCKNNEIQRNFELWDQENYFVIQWNLVIKRSDNKTLL